MTVHVPQPYRKILSPCAIVVEQLQAFSTPLVDLLDYQFGIASSRGNLLQTTTDCSDCPKNSIGSGGHLKVVAPKHSLELRLLNNVCWQ